MAVYKKEKQGITIIYHVGKGRLYILEIYLDRKWEYTGKKEAKRRLVVDSIRAIRKLHGLEPPLDLRVPQDYQDELGPLGKRLLNTRA